MTDADFMANDYHLSGATTGTVLNRGAITTTEGGFVALLGANVSNQGVIAAKLGSVVLAAGQAMTLDVAGDKLLNIVIDQGMLNALVENGGLIQADGGHVLMTTAVRRQSAD
jgi:large exoprotein involved in heme utilization and adhesion